MRTANAPVSSGVSEATGGVRPAETFLTESPRVATEAS